MKLFLTRKDAKLVFGEDIVDSARPFGDRASRFSIRELFNIAIAKNKAILGHHLVATGVVAESPFVEDFLQKFEVVPTEAEQAFDANLKNFLRDHPTIGIGLLSEILEWSPQTIYLLEKTNELPAREHKRWRTTEIVAFANRGCAY